MPLVAHLPNHPLRAGLRLLWLTGLAVGLLIGGVGWRASAEEPDAEASSEALEYQLKAGFLFNFAKFVHWPTNNLATNEFRIGVLGRSKAYPVLDAALAGKTIENRIVKVMQVRNTNEAVNCQMLFVPRAASEKSQKISQEVSLLPILTVGEETGFATRGGCINLVPRQQSIRFEINLKACEKAGLKVSAKLASMATLVKTEEQP